ncbi:MAG: PKD domain-containing protein [Planctomycetes bacterium]|nr:PKD domain-containing protein [Planctomycetota bacterium]
MFGRLRWGASCALMVLAGAVCLTGCETPGATGGPNNPGAADGDTQVAVNGDASSDLVAQAKVADGSSFSIFGNKAADGSVEQLGQVDLLLADGESVTLELDDQERPIRIEGSESTTTFSYDDSTATVQAEVVDSAGTSNLDGDVAATQAAKTVGPVQTFNPTAQSLCERLGQSQGVLSNLFPCETDEASDGDSDCRGRGPNVLRVFRQFCEGQAEAVDSIGGNLSDIRKEIPLGVEGFFTTRPRDEGATVILVAVVFGGVKPIQSVVWELTTGPEVPIENLPRGVAVGDVGEEGPYTFTATATDANGNTATTEVVVARGQRLDIEVLADPPVAPTGEEIFFSIESNVEIPDDVLANAKWRFDDGSEATGAEVSHSFAEDGSYVVVVLLRGEGQRETGSTVVRIGGDLECWELCQIEAEQVFFECDAAGRPDVNCAARSRAVLAECVVERCGEELDCDRHCFRYGDKLRRQCIAAGGRPGVCAALSREARGFCAQEQCDEGIDCEAFCEEDFDLFAGDCADDSEATQDCELVAETDVDECVVEECGDDLDCEGGCEDQADRLFGACRDGGASSDECAARSRRFFENCVLDECEGELDCASGCEAQSRQIVKECEAEGFPTPRCRERADEFVGNCLDIHCGISVDDDVIDEPVDPDAVDELDETPEECADLCFEDGDVVFRNCRTNGGSTGECNLLADATFEDCLAEFCGADGATTDDPLGDDPLGDDPLGDDPFGDDSPGGGSSGDGGPGDGGPGDGGPGNDS